VSKIPPDELVVVVVRDVDDAKSLANHASMNMWVIGRQP
jgi:hypothetical protein